MAGKWGIEHAVFAAATAATVVGAVVGNERVQQIAKPLIAPALAARVLRKRSETETADTALLLAGLAAATVGDVFMIDPDNDARLIKGASSFAVMQASYSALLLRRGARPTRAALRPRISGWSTASGLLRAKAPSVSTPLTGYGLMLGTTSTLSADPALAPQSNAVLDVVVPNKDRRSWLGLGGVLFTASDGLIVVRRLFIRGTAGRAAAEGVILASYAGAQLMLVEGMLALDARRASSLSRAQHDSVSVLRVHHDGDCGSGSDLVFVLGSDLVLDPARVRIGTWNREVECELGQFAVDSSAQGCDGVDSCPPFEAVLFEFALGAGRAVGPCHSESENRAESGEQPADLIGQRARWGVLDQPSEPHGEHDQIPHRDETHGVYDATVIHQISSTSRIA